MSLAQEVGGLPYAACALWQLHVSLDPPGVVLAQRMLSGPQVPSPTAQTHSAAISLSRQLQQTKTPAGSQLGFMQN